ncbi:MAG: hypothetical protein H7256_04350 [Bdellovibrio sp.]|nr:hypothetical protein [Bdellovibrio sp.]
MANPQFCSADEAVKSIQSGAHIFIHGAAATPHRLIDALVARASELKDITLYHMHTEGPLEYLKPEYKETFKVRSLFVGANVRAALDFDRIDYIPCFLS